MFARTWLVNAVIVLCVSGCGGPRVATTTDSNQTATRWFCQPNEQGQWGCVLDQREHPPQTSHSPQPAPSQPAAAAAPATQAEAPSDAAAPSEIAPPAPPSEAPVEPKPASVPNVPAMAQDPVQAERAPAPPPAVAAADARPAYQRLAYQPDQPVKLTELPAEYYAVQVVALKSQRAVERWLEARELTGMSAARIANGDEIYYIVLLGVYPDFASAQRAVDERPPPLRDLTPWIRPLRALQAAIRAAEAESG